MIMQCMDYVLQDQKENIGDGLSSFSLTPITAVEAFNVAKYITNNLQTA